jgi:iron-sulfur cluster repair protein YtfE (RIC family)
MLMCAPTGLAPEDDGPSPTPLVDPIAWLFAEHGKHRELCDALAQVATLPIVTPARLRRLAGALATETALHVADEADDLFPRLRARMEPDDDIARVLGILAADHDAERSAVRELQPALLAAADAGAGPATWPGLAALIGQFVDRRRRHIALANAVLLPIARLRLTLDDQCAMARSMAARRAG